MTFKTCVLSHPDYNLRPVRDGTSSDPVVKLIFRAILLFDCRHREDLTSLRRAPVNRKTWAGSMLEKTDQLPSPFTLL